MNNDTTIGLDLGNKKHKVVGLDGRGKIILKCELSNDKETLGAFFKEHAGASVPMETGTHCRWISSLAKHHALVQLIELRDIVVAQRTQAVNAIRGMCKACGYMLPNARTHEFFAHPTCCAARFARGMPGFSTLGETRRGAGRA